MQRIHSIISALKMFSCFVYEIQRQSMRQAPRKNPDKFSVNSFTFLKRTSILSGFFCIHFYFHVRLKEEHNDFQLYACKRIVLTAKIICLFRIFQCHQEDKKRRNSFYGGTENTEYSKLRSSIRMC